MSRFFNTTGACDPRKHTMLPPERRLPELMELVDREQYFVLHAARRTGKTTAMLAFAARLRERGVAAVRATLEASQGVEDLGRAEPIWLAFIEDAARFQLDRPLRPPPHGPFLDAEPGTRLLHWLSAWCEAVHPTPVVLLLDEADVVQGPALVSLLRQLRAGFDKRPDAFPVSIALIGMRDLRDDLTHAREGSALSPGCPFNIKSASLTLRNFTADEVAELLGQHAAETGQAFDPDAVRAVFTWTQGQPYLVNALADLATQKVRGRTIAEDDIADAKQALILARTTHLDSLAQRLEEPRVARVVQAVLLGDVPTEIPYRHDDFQYVLDLGLIRQGPSGAEPANPLYREVLARELSRNLQESLVQPRWPWRLPDGRLNFPGLVEEFLRWWRENADVLSRSEPQYPEAVAHLAFMAFLQRVINGGGTVTREYAAGRKGVDLLVEYGPDRFVVEIKRIRPRDSLESVREGAIRQTLAYLDLVGVSEGWILLFDQRPGRDWTARLWSETVERQGKTLRLFGG